MRILLLLLSLFFIPSLTAAQLSWEVKTQGFTQFNPLILEVVYLGAEGNLPPLITPEHLGAAFHLIDVKALSNEALNSKGQIKRVVQYNILPLKAGVQRLAPLTQGNLSTEALDFQIAESAFEVTAPELQPPPPPSFIWWPLFIAASLVPLVYFLFAREPKEKITALKLATPKEQALAEIEKLKQSNLIVSHQWDGFYSQLSWIFREYIEKSGFSHALGKTTVEFLAEAQRQGLFTQAEREGLAHFLSFSDLVKFAQAKAGEVSANQALEEVLAYINKGQDGV